MHLNYFDVIIADYSIPDIDGITLLKGVRARGYVGIFIIVTGKHRAHIAIDALNHGANYYFQKGGEAVQDIPQLVTFIRKGVGKNYGGSPHPESGSRYRSIIDDHPDLLCRFRPDGTITFVNDTYGQFAGVPADTCPGSNFIATIPGKDRKAVELQLQALTPAKPGVFIEHAVLKGDGSAPTLHWSYRALFTQGGNVTEYQTSGRDISDLARQGEVPGERNTAPTNSLPQVPAPSPASSEEWKFLAETIKTLENPVFAIDRHGMVITWNAAMEQLTGVLESDMLGKGGNTYAIPFYGEARPMLIDYIITPADKIVPGKFPAIKKVGDTFIGEMEHVKILGKPMFLWGKGTAVRDAKGDLIAAVQVITVGERQVVPDGIVQEAFWAEFPA